MSEHRVMFSEPMRFMAEPGMNDAVARAARQARTSSAEWMRRALRARLTADGIPLPSLGSNDDDPGPTAPAARQAA